MTTRRGRASVPVFLALAFGLSWWPWLGRLDNPAAAVLLPVGPSLAALMLSSGPERRALARALSPRGIGRRWWFLLLPVGVGLIAAAAAWSLGARPAGDGWPHALAVLALTPLTAVVAGPLGEELGWRGWLLPRLSCRWSAITSSLLVAVAWLAFHLPLVLTEPSRHGVPWALTLVSVSLVLTWTRLATGGNLLLAVLLHALTNSTAAAAIQLFGPADQALLWWAVAVPWVAVGLVTVLVPLRQVPRVQTAGATDPVRHLLPHRNPHTNPHPDPHPDLHHSSRPTEETP